MTNKRKDEEFKSDFNADDTNPNKFFKDADALERGESVSADSVVDPTTPVPAVVKCPACNGTGSVPENLLNGVVDKWKNCPMCGATGTAPKVVDENVDPYRCTECNGSGKVADTFVDGNPDTYKNCPTCEGKGVKLPNV